MSRISSPDESDFFGIDARGQKLLTIDKGICPFLASRFRTVVRANRGRRPHSGGSESRAVKKPCAGLLTARECGPDKSEAIGEGRGPGLIRRAGAAGRPIICFLARHPPPVPRNPARARQCPPRPQPLRRLALMLCTTGARPWRGERAGRCGNPTPCCKETPAAPPNARAAGAYRSGSQ
jgi:hypothetical protein